MSRPIQVGDFARVILDNEIQTYPIEFIEGNTIYLSVEEGESLRLIPLDGEYQVQGLEVNHQVEFLANDSPVMTGLAELDLILLEELEDDDLETICQVDEYVRSLCEGDQLWINKIVRRYGQGFVTKRPHNLSFKDYYYLLDYPHSVAGANLAVARNDHQGLEFLQSLGFSPDITREEPSGFLTRPPLGGNGNQGIPIQLRTGNAEPVQHLFGRMSEDLMNFFREVDVGPQIAGSFINVQGTNQPDINSLVPIEGTRLNDLFYFLQPQINGQTNPLYGFFPLRSPMRLSFYYYNLPHADEGHRSASDAMRLHLGNIMRRMVDISVGRFQDTSGIAFEKGELLKQAINDPSLKINDRLIINGQERTIFNPNNFREWHFSDIILGGLLNQVKFELDSFEVSQVYSIIPGINPENALEEVSRLYSQIISLAEAYQNLSS